MGACWPGKLSSRSVKSSKFLGFFLIDTHCHLTHARLIEEQDGIVARAREAGLDACITIGTGTDDARAVLASIERHRGFLFGTAGLDPFSSHRAGDGFDAEDIVAKGSEQRGSFVDLLDDAGPDHSRAVVEQTYIERGSGPLHAILRVEGRYEYERDDNPPAPFVTRIHAYADRSYLRVLHTFVYTGVPDKHRPLEGEYAHLATQGEHCSRAAEF